MNHQQQQDIQDGIARARKRYESAPGPILPSLETIAVSWTATDAEITEVNEELREVERRRRDLEARHKRLAALDTSLKVAYRSLVGEVDERALRTVELGKEMRGMVVLVEQRTRTTIGQGAA